MSNTKMLNVSFAKSGNGYDTTRLIIPLSWVKALGITPEEREVTATLNAGRIIIKKS